MEALVIVLALAGAAAPIVGVIRIYIRLRAERERRSTLAAERGHGRKTMADQNAEVARSWDIGPALKDTRIDLALVLLGFALTAASTVLGTFV